MRNRPISDKEWEARWDAESLAKAEEINADPSRKTAAETAARKIAEEKQKELSGINRVANRGKGRETAEQSTQNRIITPSSKPKTAKKGAAPKTPGFNVFQNISR